MPKLKRPDGVEIHWEERGEGPAVLFCPGFMGAPEVFQRGFDDLATDHRVVVYHLRGTGESSRVGPYDWGTDEADIEALLEEAGGPAVVVGMADGANRAVRLAARRPDLISAVISPGGNPLGREASKGTDGLAASNAVLEALVEMISHDYRGALRTLITGTNPQMTEDEIRERVSHQARYADHDASVERLRAWIPDTALEEALELGDRLWILQHPGNPWFPIEVLKRTRELLPEAHVLETEDGPLSRPDITTAIVRRITAQIHAEAQTA